MRLFVDNFDSADPDTVLVIEDDGRVVEYQASTVADILLIAAPEASEAIS